MRIYNLKPDVIEKSGIEIKTFPVWQETLATATDLIPVTEDQDYFIDPLQSGVLRLDFRVLGSLDENINYYENTIVGNFTKSYIDAFDRIGSSVKVSQFEPLVGATDTGRTGYSDPIVTTTKVLVDPQTYNFPTINKEEPYFTQYIERDIRKIFFKPNFFIGRNYIKNDGGFIKRSVWTIKYMGNDYEISQVVPRFINNEICFYEANAYVIGPSNDPFRKLTLPSES